MKKINFIISIMLASAFCGCSLFVPHNQKIVINGEPADAIVVLNGERIQCPAEMEVPKNKNLKLSVHKKGYHPFEKTYGYSMGPWGILDLIGGYVFILPLIGLISPGAFELNQDSLYYVLTPVENKK